MTKGHLDQTRKNQKATKTKTSTNKATTEDIEINTFPSSDPENLRPNFCYAAVAEYPTGRIHIDQTGKFPVPSSQGMNYPLVLYEYDSNSIHAELMKNRTANKIFRAYKVIHATIVKAGLEPKLQRLDIKCSQILKDSMHYFPRGIY
jgi:hypothetical protein